MGFLKGQPDCRGYLIFLCSPAFSTLSWENNSKVGWAEPQDADLLGLGYCCFLPSLKQVCGIQGTSWAPTTLTPADASFPSEIVATPLWAAVGFFGGEGAWGCLFLLQPLLTSGHFLSFPSPPLAPCPLAVAPVNLLGRSPLAS